MSSSLCNSIYPKNNLSRWKLATLSSRRCKIKFSPSFWRRPRRLLNSLSRGTEVSCQYTSSKTSLKLTIIRSWSKKQTALFQVMPTTMRRIKLQIKRESSKNSVAFKHCPRATKKPQPASKKIWVSGKFSTQLWPMSSSTSFSIWDSNFVRTRWC